MAQGASAIALYRRGPNWDGSKPIGEQDAIREHFAHMGRLMGDGTIERGGPFHRIDDFVETELVALVVYTVPVEEARQLSDADPVVAAGLMVCDVMPWYP